MTKQDYVDHYMSMMDDARRESSVAVEPRETRRFAALDAPRVIVARAYHGSQCREGGVLVCGFPEEHAGEPIDVDYDSEWSVDR